MQLRINFIIATELKVSQCFLILSFSLFIVERQHCFSIIIIAFDQLLLNLEIILIIAFIILNYLFEQAYSLRHITLVINAHGYFHSNFTLKIDSFFIFYFLKELDGIIVRSRSLLILFHFFKDISKRFFRQTRLKSILLTGIKLHKVLQCSLTLIHHQIYLSSHQIPIFELRKITYTIRYRLKRLLVIPNLPLNNTLEQQRLFEILFFNISFFGKNGYDALFWTDFI